MSNPALQITDLRKIYENGVEALKGVSLTVEPGDFFALLGPNGAGKSTLIGVVSSLVNSSSGSVKVFGVDIAAERSAAMRLIGLVPQEVNFNMFEKPLDILVNYAGFYGMPRAEALVRAEEELKAAQLWPKAHMMSRTLSGGMKRRLMIARAMMTRAAPADPRRTDRRRGHRDPSRHVEDLEGGQRRRHHGDPDHALPGRSREPVPQPGDHRSRPDHRAGPDEAAALEAGCRGLHLRHRGHAADQPAA